jgi:hypothetical protein
VSAKRLLAGTVVGREVFPVYHRGNSILIPFSTKAIFVDTDLVPAHETYCGNLIQNNVEALLVHQVGF